VLHVCESRAAGHALVDRPPVAPLGLRANVTQEALGNAIQKWAENNWYRLGIDYVIWWNWMKEDKYTSRFWYEPYAWE
jgi:hypothetical protein